MSIQTEPTDTQIEAVIQAIDSIIPFINPRDGKIYGAGWPPSATMNCG